MCTVCKTLINTFQLYAFFNLLKYLEATAMKCSTQYSVSRSMLPRCGVKGHQDPLVLIIHV